MIALTKGGNTSVAGTALQARLSWLVEPNTPEVELSALLLGSDGAVRTDDDFVFFNQPRHASGAVELARAATKDAAELNVDLTGIEPGIDRVLIVASVNADVFLAVQDLLLRVIEQESGEEIARFADIGATVETALVAGEFYRRGGAWKFRAVGQGWASGLAGLATDYGISIDEGATDKIEPSHQQPNPEGGPTGATPGPTEIEQDVDGSPDTTGSSSGDAVSSTPTAVFVGLLGTRWELRREGLLILRRQEQLLVPYSTIADVEMKPLDIVTRGHIRIVLQEGRSNPPTASDPHAILTKGIALRFGPVNAELGAFANELRARIGGKPAPHTSRTRSAVPSGRTASPSTPPSASVTTVEAPAVSRGASEPLVRYRPPGNLWPSVNVVGESHYFAAIQHALGPLRRGEDREVEVEATLVAEPKNRYDRNAITVQLDGAVVGYLSREDALAWRPVIDQLSAAGALLSPRARVWGANRVAAEGGFYGSVQIALPRPELALPLNAPPVEPYSVVPWGARLKINGEPAQLNPLAGYLGRQPEGLLLVTLQVRVEGLPRGAERTIVDAVVEGVAVGSLTPVSSKNIAPLIEHLQMRGLTAASWAAIRGSTLAVELGLHASRAAEVPEEWLDAGPTTVPRWPRGGR